MNTEYEATFPDIDFKEFREVMKKSGARLVNERRMLRRVVFKHKNKNERRGDSYIRLRDEGDKFTLSYKQYDENSIDGVKEIETTVGDFDSTRQIIGKTDFVETAYQETFRETWEIDSVKIELDEWPWINPFVEVEGDSEESVGSAVTKLGLNFDDALFGDVGQIYIREFDIGEQDVYELAEITFNYDHPNNWVRKKN